MSPKVHEFSFDIRHSCGKRERTKASSERILIGSGAHCDVRLAPGQAALEHVMLESLPTGSQFRNLVPMPPALLDGVALTSLPFPFTSTVKLCIGMNELQISRDLPAEGTRSRRNGLVIFAKFGAIFALSGAIFFVSRTGRNEVLTGSPELPELFGTTITKCPRTDLVEARVFADDQRINGDGASERSPFDPRGARAAIQSYEVASACYRLAQNVELSENVAQTARRIREESLVDLRTRRVRLDRLLLVKDYELASQDVAVLRALTEGNNGEYRRWLTGVAQRIKSETAESNQ